MVRPLPSQCHSSATLVRGAGIMNETEMSLQDDEQLREMQAEREKLLVASLISEGS